MQYGHERWPDLGQLPIPCLYWDKEAPSDAGDSTVVYACERRKVILSQISPLQQASSPTRKKGIWGFHIPVFSGGMAGYFDWIFRPFIWAAGGKYISDDLQSVAFDSPEAKEAVQVLL